MQWDSFSALRFPSPFSQIKDYLGISLNATHLYLCFNITDKTYKLGTQTIASDKDPEIKNRKQNALFEKIIKDLTGEVALKPLSDFLLSLLSKKDAASMSPDKTDLDQLIANSENIFIQHLILIEQEENIRERIKVDIVTATFFERIQKIPNYKGVERYHRLSLANALEWHREQYFQKRPLHDLSLRLCRKDEIEHSNLKETVLSQENEHTNRKGVSKPHISKKVSRLAFNEIGSPHSLSLSFTESDSSSISPPRHLNSSPQHLNPSSISPRHLNSSSISPRHRDFISSAPTTSKSNELLSKPRSKSSGISTRRSASQSSSPPQKVSKTDSALLSLPQTSFEIQQSKNQIHYHAHYIEKIKHLSDEGLEYCRLFCQSAITKDKKDFQSMKELENKLIAAEYKSIRQNELLQKSLMRYVIQESIDRAIAHSLTLDSLCLDIERDFEYVEMIINHKKIFNFLPIEGMNSETEITDQDSFKHKCGEFSRFLKLLLNQIEHSDSSNVKQVILGIWGECISKESQPSITNITFPNTCNRFLSYLTVNSFDQDRQRVQSLLYTLLTAMTQMTYAKSSIALMRAFPNFHLKPSTSDLRSFQYEFVPESNTILYHSLLTLKSSHNLSLPNFKIVILNQFSINQLNPKFGACETSLEVIPISPIQTQHSSETSFHDSKQINKNVLTPLKQMGFKSIMKQDSSGKFL